MSIIPFDEKELAVVKETPASPKWPQMKHYSYPVSCKEAQRSAFHMKPYWQIIGTEQQTFTPRVFPDNVSRGLVIEAEPFNPVEEGGGKDMFGIEWIYDPNAGGSMVRPGSPLFNDANDWERILAWPEIESWNWAESAKANKSFLTEERFNVVWITSGWFERLISFMDFEDAILAVFDESQRGAVKRLFDKLSDLYISLINAFVKHFPGIDGFYIHDDWGSAQNTFFSPEIAEEMIVPYMRKVTDHLHSKELTAELHSCGNNIKQVPNIINAGWDAWSPQGDVNDTREIHRQYGDKILIGVMPDPLSDDASEKGRYDAACAYADEFCSPDKPSFLNVQARGMLTPPFREGLYVQSRKNYSA